MKEKSICCSLALKLTGMESVYFSLDDLVGTASMRSMTFLQVDRCSNEPFSTYCVYCVFYKLILRILRILQIIILEYCVYCVFYKLTSADIAYIAYITYIALRILCNIALGCVALRILQQASYKQEIRTFFASNSKFGISLN